MTTVRKTNLGTMGREVGMKEGEHGYDSHRCLLTQVGCTEQQLCTEVSSTAISKPAARKPSGERQGGKEEEGTHKPMSLLSCDTEEVLNKL